MSSHKQQQAHEAALEDIEVEGITNVKMHMHKIYSIWREFGIDIDQKSHRAKAVWTHIHTLLKDIYEEEHSFYEEINERIDNYTKKIKELARVLGVTPNEAPGSSLIKREEMLRQELDTLTKLKHKRMKSYQDLKSVEIKYCQILNVQEHQLPSNTGVPSEIDLSELEQHVNMLKEEKDRRQKKLFLVKKELTTILETTELSPESSLEKDILSGKETPLTDETFKALEEVINKAHKRKEELEARKKNLVNKLTVLWQRLKVEESKRVEFLSKHTDCRLSTINSIERELERFEKIKKENIESFVTSLRQELKLLWDKCHVSQSERGLFYYLSATEMSDEVLEAHEAEVDRLKRYHAEIEHILKKIEKRQKLWDLMIVFENKAADPNRFKNRKGNLLQEERERKKLQKDLPALENNIFCDVEAFEIKSGSAFLYNGEDFRSFVTNQWTERIQQKENEKLERHNKYLLQLGNEATLGTPAKRPLKTTPMSAPSKLFKSTMGVSAFRTPVPNSSKVTPNTVGRLTTKNSRLFPSRQNAIQKKDKMVLREINKQATSPNGTTYTDFASELNSTARYNYRSSVLATKKRGGTRISQSENNRSKRRSAAKSLRKSIRNTSKITTNLTPARGKLGLPFLI